MDTTYIIVGSWGICGIIAAIIGSQKSGALGAIFGLLVGCLLGPIGVLWALISPGQTRQCRECRKRVDKRATRCPYCRSQIAF
jgi:hypothetical protein